MLFVIITRPNRMLAHKFVEQSAGSELSLRKQREKKSWWSFGWWISLPYADISICSISPAQHISLCICDYNYPRTSRPVKDENEPGILTEEDWKRLNDIIGYKEGDEDQLLTQDNGRPYIFLKLCMKHNASKLIDSEECLADLSCDNLESCIKLYPEAKIVDIKLGSYRLLSPNGLLAEVWCILDVFMCYLPYISPNNLVTLLFKNSTLQSESESDSLVALFCYKPPDGDIDWSLVAKASPCYVTVRC